MKTYAPKPEHVQRRWYVLDARDQVLGRLATEAAHILRGKHKPIYAPHADVGDHVIIVNAAKVVLTGGKERKKVAYRHSGHPGGITATLYEDLLARRPAFAVEKAVRGMLPKNRLGRAMIKKLHVEAGPEHRHHAQKPAAWAIGDRPAWEGLPVPAPGPAPANVDEEPDGGTSSTASTAERTAARATSSTRADSDTRKSTATKRSTASRKSTATRKPTAARKASSASASSTSRTSTSAASTTTTSSATRKGSASKAKSTAKKPTSRKKRET